MMQLTGVLSHNIATIGGFKLNRMLVNLVRGGGGGGHANEKNRKTVLKVVPTPPLQTAEISSVWSCVFSGMTQ